MCLSHYDAEGKFVAPAEGKAACCAKKMDKVITVNIENVDGKAKATVKSSSNGTANVQTFEGTLDEVKAKVEALK
jgi:K(+)-stimulated pyrophosphate-energized sodium pump